MGSTSDGGSGGNMADIKLLHKDTIQLAVHELQKGVSRSRKTRIKLMSTVTTYFTSVIRLLAEHDRSEVRERLFEVVQDIMDLIIETTNLVLSFPDANAADIYDLLYDTGAYIEGVMIAVYDICKRRDILFGELTKDFLKSLIKISGENPERWLYSVLITPLVCNMLNVFAKPNHEELRISWCYEIADLMFQIGNAIFECGDYACQYFLITILSNWAKWTTPGRSLPVINSQFSFVNADIRKKLLCDSPDLTELTTSIRTFLNAFNISPRVPGRVITIACKCLFVCNKEIRPLEHRVETTPEFWVDFSIKSGRIHTFYPVPEYDTVNSLSIRRDQVDSVCLNWVVNDGRSQESGTEDGDTQSTFRKDDKVLFFHVILSVDFDVIANDLKSLFGKQYRSLYFVFRQGELVEKVMQDMGYNIHECGTKNCERPRELRKLLSTQHKVSYTESWCPDSQVHGLDATLNGSATSTRSGMSRCTDLDQSHRTTDENQEMDDIRFDIISNSTFNVSRLSNISGCTNLNITSFTTSGSFTHDSSDENGALGPLRKMLRDSSIPCDIKSVRIGGSGRKKKAIQNMSVLEDDENAMQVSVNEASVYRTISNHGNETPYSAISASVAEESKENQIKTKNAGQTPLKMRNISIASGDNETFVTVSDQTCVDDPEEFHENEEDLQNVSKLTDFEDPLPRSARKKYAHLYHHAPFEQKKNAKKFKFVKRLCSTPKPSSRLSDPITPPISEIGSPHRDIYNTTVVNGNFDELSSPETPSPILGLSKSSLTSTSSTSCGSLEQFAQPSEILNQEKTFKNSVSPTNNSTCVNSIQEASSSPSVFNQTPDESIQNWTFPKSFIVGRTQEHSISHTSFNRTPTPSFQNAQSHEFTRTPEVSLRISPSPEFQESSRTPKESIPNTPCSTLTGKPNHFLLDQLSLLNAAPDQTIQNSPISLLSRTPQQSVQNSPVSNSSSEKASEDPASPLSPSFNITTENSVHYSSPSDSPTDKQTPEQSFQMSQFPQPRIFSHTSEQFIPDSQNAIFHHTLEQSIQRTLTQHSFQNSLAPLVHRNLEQPFQEYPFPTLDRTPQTSIQPSPTLDRAPQTSIQPSPTLDRTPQTSIQPSPTLDRTPQTSIQPSPTLDRTPQTPIQPTPTLNRTSQTSNKASVPLNLEHTSRSSPVVNLSPEGSMPSLVLSILNGTSKRAKKRSSTGKVPCYANAFQEWTRKIEEKKLIDDYDPYDLWTSSEMDQWKDQIFKSPKPYKANKKVTRVKKKPATKKKISNGTTRKLNIVKHTSIFNT